MFTGKGKGRGRVRPEDEEELGNSRPSAPSTLFDFLESKMGTLTVEGKLLKLMFLEPRLDCVGGIGFPNLSSKRWFLELLPQSAVKTKQQTRSARDLFLFFQETSNKSHCGALCFSLDCRIA